MLKRYHGERKGASAFELLPAIDLRGGRVVRLVEGDFRRETAYSDDPVGVARAFADRGARWIHVVDLDGARAGEPAQAATVRAIVEAVAGGRPRPATPNRVSSKQTQQPGRGREGRRAVAVGRNHREPAAMGAVRCQVAGGLRSEAAVAAALEAGAARVVVGTAAIRDPAFAGRLVARHGPDRIVAALDVRAGLALGEGWRPGAPGVLPADAVAALADEGVAIFAVTAIERDGRLEGPDLDLLASLIALDRGRVIASGGIGSLDDLRRVRGVGCAGAIVGTALYEGRLDLGEAIAELA